MPTTDGSANARTTDPQTSKDAAKLNREAKAEQKKAILWLLQNIGPMTDHELTYHYAKNRAKKGWPATQADGVRKRRSDLKNEGKVVSTGRTSGFALGHAPSTVWTVAA